MFAKYRACARDVIKTEEPLKVLSSSGIRGTKFIPVYKFPTQCRPSFGNQHILNFEVMAARDIKLRSRLSKTYTYMYLVIFSHFRSLSIRKGACVNVFLARFRKSVD